MLIKFICRPLILLSCLAFTDVHQRVDRRRVNILFLSSLCRAFKGRAALNFDFGE